MEQRAIGNGHIDLGKIKSGRAAAVVKICFERFAFVL